MKQLQWLPLSQQDKAVEINEGVTVHRVSCSVAIRKPVLDWVIGKLFDRREQKKISLAFHECSGRGCRLVAIKSVKSAWL